MVHCTLLTISRPRPNGTTKPLVLMTARAVPYSICTTLIFMMLWRICVVLMEVFSFMISMVLLSISLLQVDPASTG